MKTILLLSGGGGTEHEISQVSSAYLQKSITPYFKVLHIEMTKEGKWLLENQEEASLRADKKLYTASGASHTIDYVIPCIHGTPGETGDIQSYLEIIGLPYFGCKAEACTLTFNKVSTKLWLSAANISNTPFVFLSDLDQSQKAFDFFEQWKNVFVKAASQGSSVGCYHVTSKDELLQSLSLAFKFSPYVLIEKCVIGRELEVSVYEYDNVLHVSSPGEIICTPHGWYDYNEKYSPESKTKTLVTAPNLDDHHITKIKEMAKKTFELFKLRHLSRIDFLMESTGEIYINEVNTFPGLTPISMFPKMMESNGHQFEKFIVQNIQKDLNS